MFSSSPITRECEDQHAKSQVISGSGRRVLCHAEPQQLGNGGGEGHGELLDRGREEPVGSSPARSQDGSSDPCGREHGIGLRGRDGGGTMNVSTARLSSLFEPSASTNPSSLTLKSSMSLHMTKSQSPSSLQTCSSSTRRRMARERRGAGSSLVSMETPY